MAGEALARHRGQGGLDLPSLIQEGDHYGRTMGKKLMAFEKQAGHAQKSCRDQAVELESDVKGNCKPLEGC